MSEKKNYLDIGLSLFVFPKKDNSTSPSNKIKPVVLFG